MKKIVICLILLLLCTTLFAGAASARGQNHARDIAEARKIIDSGAGCDRLTDDQLEALGEYYMEQMHTGEAHESMDRMMSHMMGEAGLRQIHINMGIRWYCGGMMGHGGGMMGSGRGPYGNASQYNYPMGGMMGSRGGMMDYGQGRQAQAGI